MTSHSVAIAWRTEKPMQGCIRLTPATRANQHLFWQGTIVTNRPLITLDGLSPNTTYTYQIMSGNKALTSPLRFTTFPDNESDPYSFAVLGDSGTASDEQKEIAQQIFRHHPDFVLHTGDVIYGGRNDTDFDKKFFSIYSMITEHVPFFLSLGNHDEGFQHGIPYLQNFYPPQNSPGKGRYYSFDCANAHLIALDSNQSMSPESEQYHWLSEDLTTTRKPMKIIFFHHPLYSSGFHGSTMRLRRTLVPLFEHFHVFLVFNGHDHDYERSVTIHGITYVVTGGGGAALYGASGEAWTARSQNAFHFVLCQVHGPSVHLEAINARGETLDKTDLTLFRQKHSCSLRNREQLCFRDFKNGFGGALPNPLNPMKKRVVVAMSGGVDSSVAASLLVDAGYDVIGLTMQTSPSDAGLRSGGKQRGCCGADAALDAFAVAEKLGIPHYVLNFQEVFRKHVIENFTKEYAAGRTPNPCVRCNEFVKFDALRKKTVDLGASALATGHYAKVAYAANSDRYILSKGVDREKDQSYVLYPLTQSELEMSLFPLGSLTKSNVRQYANDRGLPTANKAESYDICFVPDGNYAAFVERQLEEKPATGPIVNLEGKVIGEHRGLIHYTIGQRRGLGLTSNTPLFVLAIQPEANVLVVGEEEKLLQNRCNAMEINWVSIPPPLGRIRVKARIRYHAEEAPATLIPVSETAAEILFDEPQKAITPGQSIVFYNEDEVLGGGTLT